MYTVKFTVRAEEHVNGTYEDFDQAYAKCLELVTTEADDAWVELTEQTELRTKKEYKKEPDPPLEEVLDDLARLADDGNPHRSRKKKK
jgi:phosphoglycolate phosphatase-like HAD superfamily hydrolase